MPFCRSAAFFNRQDILRRYKALGITPALAGNFFARTQNHIRRVFHNAERLDAAFPNRFPGLLDQAADHDQSKFHDPERLPYIWLTEFYRCKDSNTPFTYPSGMKPRVDQATLHHIRSNPHHPEYWDPNKSEITLNEDRDSSEQPQVTDATRMSPTALAEQVCDWAAMSEEKHTSLHDWASKTINHRWRFSPSQVSLLNELVDFFEPSPTTFTKSAARISARIYEVPLFSIQTSPDGLAIAYSNFSWKPGLKLSTEPVAVTKLPSGRLYLLNGYHRYVAAKKLGLPTILVKQFPFVGATRTRVEQELGSVTNRQAFKLSNPAVKITIIGTPSLKTDGFLDLLQYIKKNGDPGHSFDIVVDPDRKENTDYFGFDGDGADRIRSIEVEDLP